MGPRLVPPLLATGLILLGLVAPYQAGPPTAVESNFDDSISWTTHVDGVDQVVVIIVDSVTPGERTLVFDIWEQDVDHAPKDLMTVAWFGHLDHLSKPFDLYPVKNETRRLDHDNWVGDFFQNRATVYGSETHVQIQDDRTSPFGDDRPGDYEMWWPLWGPSSFIKNVTLDEGPYAFVFGSTSGFRVDISLTGVVELGRGASGEVAQATSSSEAFGQEASIASGNRLRRLAAQVGLEGSVDTDAGSFVVVQAWADVDLGVRAEAPGVGEIPVVPKGFGGPGVGVGGGVFVVDMERYTEAYWNIIEGGQVRVSADALVNPGSSGGLSLSVFTYGPVLREVLSTATT